MTTCFFLCREITLACTICWARIRYTGLDADGHAIEREAEGFHARVVQHECDHLIGKLYPMRVREFSRFGYTSVLFPELDAEADD